MQNFKSLLLSSLLAGCFVSSAQADADDTFNIYLSASAQRDSNLFRQSANEQGDTLQTTSLTLALNKPFAQQLFSLQATAVDYRYSQNDYLNYRAMNYNGAWNWALTHRLTGVLSFSQSEAQNSFVDYTVSGPQTRPNVRKTIVNRFSAEWQVMGGWRLLGGVTGNEQKNSSAFNAQSSYVLNTWEGGIKYLWPAGNYLQVVQREGTGEYSDRPLVDFNTVPAPFNPQFDTGFTQAETEARLFVPLTGKTSLSARLARQSRKHDHFVQRDYAANVGRIDLSWQAAGKLLLTGGLRREVAAYQDFFSSYYIVDGINLQPSWQITSKVAMRLNYDWQRRKFDGELIAGVPDRSDTLQSLALGVDWFPVRWASLSANLQRDSRNSNRSNLDFKAEIYSLNARFNF